MKKRQFSPLQYLRTIESQIIASMIKSENAFEIITNKLVSENFLFYVHKKIFEYLHSYLQENNNFNHSTEEIAEIAREIHLLYSINMKTTIDLLYGKQSENLELDIFELKEFNEKQSEIMTKENNDEDVFQVFRVEDEYGFYTGIYKNNALIDYKTSYLFHLANELHETFLESFDGMQEYINKEDCEVILELDENENPTAFVIKKNISLTNKLETIIEWANEKSLNYVKFPRNRGRLLDLTDLSLEDSNLITLPNELFEITKNAYLVSFMNNNLNEIPKNINLLTKVFALMFCDNKITKISEELFELKQLILLCFHNNRLTEIPQSISNLKRLTMLSISNNNISKLPESISQLSNLTQLDIENTFIQEDSLQYVNLENLEKISFNDDLMPYILENFHRLPKIDSINLKYSKYSINDPKIKTLNLNEDFEEWMKEKDNLGHGYIQLFMYKELEDDIIL